MLLIQDFESLKKDIRQKKRATIHKTDRTMWLVFCTGIKQRTASNKYYAYGNGSSESGTCLPSHRFEAIFRRSKALDFYGGRI